jgi:hypothetical protein
LPDWGAEIASFDSDHLRRHFPQARIETLSVETRTFAQAATLLPGGRVDLVALDVEGHERAILESIDYDRHGVKFLIFEHKHIRTDDMRAVRERLEGAGFELKSLGRDTVAWRQS